MKMTLLLAVAALLAQIGSSLSVPQRGDGLKVVGLQTERQAPRNPAHRDNLRKRGSLAVGVDNEETLYFINATIGTPGTSVRLHLDTGSSDLWVNTPSSQLCTGSGQPCRFAGTYAANSSSTYEYIGSYFNITYVDGTGASGDYVSDTITIGGRKLDRLQFGIGYSSTNTQGILGIGYPANEVQVNRAGLSPYKNLPAQMVADGLIKSTAYSIWLNDLDANTGNILFGGVDSEKYTPPLLSIPIEAESGVYAEFMITLTDLTLGTTTLASNLALAVLLDTGSSLTYLPDSLVQKIYTAVDAVYDSDANAAYVPCSLASDSTTRLNFTFTSATISVEMNELVLDLVTSTGQRPKFSNGVDACLFGIGPAGTGSNVLGDTFLRSAYVVYDLDNNYISLARTKFNTTSTNVLEIGTGEDAVPGATKVANPVRATEGLRQPGSATAPELSSSAGVKLSDGTALALSIALLTGVLLLV
ncbi:aspartic peptidase domain-containing protein [Achaetomium macrosporum]|uniref:Probable aspartic-type endopeptidase OPSB n=1 Tax=Achaetomium macrosporum TaxID=79813 RepID=A0AAN7HBQ0_9PEZI|nr:aspartic peptidase domain-containing protein [Achaetomium macrosporum]